MSKGSSPAPANVTYVTNEKLLQALQLASGETLGALAILIDKWKFSEEAVAHALVGWATALRHATGRFDPSGSAPEAAAVRLVPEEMARRYLLVPLKADREKLTVAMANPFDLPAKDQVKSLAKRELQVLGATRTEIEEAIKAAYAPPPPPAPSAAPAPPPPPAPSRRPEGVDLPKLQIQAAPQKKRPEDAPVVSAVQEVSIVTKVDKMIADAIDKRASDIHLEPRVHGLQVRIRVDGQMQELTPPLPKDEGQRLVARVKVLAKGVVITESRLPQDGRFKVSRGDREVDLRVSTLPTYLGEKVVMRILGGGVIPDIAGLGFEPEDLDRLLRVAENPQGMILVTGPTGSGKTTTLYSLLKHKLKPEVNIITVEDPVEFQLPGTNQVQVHPEIGLTFARSLRACLRQDPDIILVGEIRDRETAEMAFHASQTGHFVLSTLHTNSAPATVGRLLDLGIDPRVVTSSVLLIMAQRLARRICPRCKCRYEPTGTVLGRLRLPGEGAYYQGAKCAECNWKGYSGRTGLYELLVMTGAVRDSIHQTKPEGEIAKAARAGGYRTLLERGLAKVRASLTTPEELLRVLQVEEEGTEPGEAAGADQGTEIAAMLFADAAGFSNLTEQQVGLYARHFLGAIGDLAARAECAPVMTSTSGENLLLVFSGVRPAGRFALDLCDLVANTDWEQKGLPKDLGLRINLHAGPVYKRKNPQTGQAEYIGPHASPSARIEPATPPGQVYATERFAALAAAEGATDVVCEEIKQAPLATGAARSVIYHVRRRT